jgi:hypothetical protein
MKSNSIGCAVALLRDVKRYAALDKGVIEDYKLAEE